MNADTRRSAPDTRALNIATAPKRNSRHWQQATTTWDDVLAWVNSPASVKECGGHLLGLLRKTTEKHQRPDGTFYECDGLHRNADAVVSRDVLTLDVDGHRPDLPDVLDLLGWTALVHTTFSSRPGALRLRVLLPLSRSVTPDEYRRLARWARRTLRDDQFDPGGDQPERFMYLPAAQDEAHFQAWQVDGTWLDVDTMLARTPSSDDAQAAAPGSGEAAASPDYDGPTYADLNDGERLMADAEVARVLADWRARLAEAADWPEAARDAKERGWEGLAYQCAWALARLAATPWTGLDEDTAQQHFNDLLPDAIAADPKCADKWRPGLVEKAAREPVEPPPWPGPLDDEPNPPAQRGPSKKLPLSVRLRLHVEAHYDVFPAGDDGRIFAQPKRGGRAEQVTGAFVMRAAQGMGATASTLSASATEAAKVLSAMAAANTPRTLALRVHHQPGRIVLDLAQRGNTRCVVVTPDGWQVQDVPPADIVFQASGRPLPTPVRGGSVDALRVLLRWAEDDPRWPLVKGWLPAALLADLPRPMLGFFGPQGSAKTTTGRFVAGVVDPKPLGVLGSGFGKNRADDETKALRSYVLAWDNVSSMSGDGADLLSRLVTGDLIEKRRLYTDDEVVTIHYRRTGVITGVTVPRGIKPDTLDRLILTGVEPLPADGRVSEAVLEAEWQQTHPRVLAGVLDLAVQMLDGLASGRGRNPAGLRMADYAEALWAIDPALYEAYAANVQTARGDAAHDDPFIGTLVSWLTVCGGTWQGTAEDARTESRQCLDDLDQWWPRNGKAFADEITRTMELLRAVGITVENRRSDGRRIKVFTLAPDASDSVEPGLTLDDLL